MPFGRTTACFARVDFRGTVGGKAASVSKLKNGMSHKGGGREADSKDLVRLQYTSTMRQCAVYMIRHKRYRMLRGGGGVLLPTTYSLPPCEER